MLVSDEINSLFVAWEEPDSNGGADILEYRIEYSREDTPGAPPESVRARPEDRTAFIDDVQANVRYLVQVVAVNEAGDGEPSGPVQGVPRSPGAPGRPRDVVVTPEVEALVVNFREPGSNGGSAITGYGYEIRLAGEVGSLSLNTVRRDGDTTPTFVIENLVADTPYLVSVFAINAIGRGLPSSPEVRGVPLAAPSIDTPPSEVQNLRVTPDVESLIVGFTAPASDGGQPVLRYRVDYVKRNNPGSEGPLFVETDDATTTSVTLEDLDAEVEYILSVVAINQVGDGPPVEGSGVPLPPGQIERVPDVPESVDVIPEQNALRVRWRAPRSDGGAPIDAYIVTYSRASGLDTFDPIIVGGSTFEALLDKPPLSSTATYLVNVAARNAVGLGPASADILAVPLPAPGPPVAFVDDVSVEPGDGRVTVLWTAPDNAVTDPPITGYEVSYVVRDGGGQLLGTQTSSSSGTAPQTIATSSGELSAIIENLENGVTILVTVAATNSAGTGPLSVPVEATPESNAPIYPPSRPYHPFIDAAGESFLDFSWRPPVSDGGSPILSYTVIAERQIFGAIFGYAEFFTFPNLPSLFTLSGRLRVRIEPLLNGFLYRLRVRAENSVGGSEFSLPPAFGQPVAAPSPPIDLRAQPGNSEAILTWDSPGNDGGREIDSYIVQFSGGGVTSQVRFSPSVVQVDSNTFVARISPLLNGVTYTFVVFAVNSIGTSLPSNSAKAQPFGVPPSPPLNLRAVSTGDSFVQLEWDRPLSDGGYPLQAYRISIFLGNELYRTDTVPFGIEGATISQTVRGLINEEQYQFGVQAVNLVGASASSNIIAATPTARTVPGPPRNLSAEPGIEDVRLSWDAPEDDGGARVTQYRIIVTNADLGESFNIAVVGPIAVLPRISVSLGPRLQAGVRYAFEVRAVNTLGFGERSTPVTVVPFGPDDRLPEITGFTVAETTGSTATLEWDEPFAAQGLPKVTDAIYLVAFYRPEFISGVQQPLSTDVTIVSIEDVAPVVGDDDEFDPFSGLGNVVPSPVRRLRGTVDGLVFGRRYVFFIEVSNRGGPGSPPSAPSIAWIGSPFLCAQPDPRQTDSASFDDDDEEEEEEEDVPGASILLRNSVNNVTYPGRLQLNENALESTAIAFGRIGVDDTPNLAFAFDNSGAAFLAWGEGRADRASLNPGNASYSIAVWAQLSSIQVGDTARIVGKLSDDFIFSDEEFDGVNADGLFILDTTGFAVQANASFFDDSYHHFALVIDRDNDPPSATGYIDGSADVEGTLFSNASIVSSAPLLVGRSAQTIGYEDARDDPLLGAVESVAVWRRALASEEVNALFGNTESICETVEESLSGVLEPPFGPSSPPQDVIAVIGNATASLSWAAPSASGGYPVTAYVIDVIETESTTSSSEEKDDEYFVSRFLGDGLTFVDPQNATRITTFVGGLDNASTYQFQILAVNAAGVSAPSERVGENPDEPL